MKWFLVLLLAAQEGDVVQIIERERMSAQNQRPFVGMVTVIARHDDGSPARGAISCSGSWFKFQDGPKQDGGWDLPFETDSRGAVVLNPFVGDYEEDPMICTALDKHGHVGRVSFTMPARQVEIIVK